METEPLAYKLNRIEKVYNNSTVNQTVGWGLINSKVPESWISSQGEGVTVMVLDSGKPNHPDLACQDKDVVSEDKIIINDVKDLDKNFVPEETIFDLNGHHTHCAGIIAARNNSIGMVGVAPKANIISAKVLNRKGSGKIQAINSALKYALEIKPDVISISAGFTRANGEMHSIIKELYNLGIPVVCAAGNGGKRQGVIWPAKYPETIAVGAFDPQGNVPHFSAKGKHLDFSAPGVSIMSTWIEGKYAELSGTSMACPFISGAIALLISKHKKLLESGLDDSINSVEKIKTSLIECSNDMGPIGKDKQWGFGVIDFNKIKNL